MEVKAYTPKNKVLQDFIDCFYILKKNSNEADTKYVTFPSLFSIVSVLHKASVLYTEENICVSQNKSKKLSSFIVSKFKKPICFEYKGSIEEITIYFKPLGLYSFLHADLNAFPDGSSFFPFPDFAEVLNKIFSIEDDEKKINQIEIYLMSKYNGAQHPFLHKLVAELCDIDNLEKPIAVLAENYNLSSKNLIKHFERHICKTPSQFKKIVRFREAMKKYIQSPKDISLTELTYILNYFDQSHLIREFKAITGFTPKYFFKNLTPLQEGKINWVFI